MLAAYTFVPVPSCNMCGALSDQFKVLGLRLNRSQGRNPRKTKGFATTIVRCDNCDLIFPDPQPVPGSVLDHYNMPTEEYWADERATPQLCPTTVSRFRGLRERFAARKHPTALDIGVGSGFTALSMKEAGFDLHGFEPVPQFREKALATLGFSGDRIRLGGIEDADYPAESFDLINFGAVLEHLYDPGGSLAKAVRWLRPGGLIVLEVPSSNWLLARLINLYFRLKRTAYVTHCSPMHSPFHLYEFSAKSFRLNGERLGYVVDTLSIDVGGDPTLPNWLQRSLRPLMAATGTGLMLRAILAKPELQAKAENPHRTG